MADGESVLIVSAKGRASRYWAQEILVEKYGRLLGLLRATIQHRRRLRVLIAGAAQVDELDPMWADHLVNLRTLAIGPLTRAVT